MRTLERMVYFLGVGGLGGGIFYWTFNSNITIGWKVLVLVLTLWSVFGTLKFIVDKK